MRAVLTHQRVIAAVRETKEKYLREEFVRPGVRISLYEINNGLCDEFARDVETLLGLNQGLCDDSEILKIVENGNFQRDADDLDTRWDTKLLSKYWQMAPPAGFTWRQLNARDYGTHIWLAAKVGPNDTWLHFDAECELGVASFFELPLFDRCIRKQWPTKDELAAHPADEVWYASQHLCAPTTRSTRLSP